VQLLRQDKILAVAPADSLPLDVASLGLPAKIVSCADFARALELFVDLDPDAMLISAGEISIQPAIRFVQRIRCESQVPCVLVTSKSSEDLAIDALNSGVSLYLRHPIDAATAAGPLFRLLRRDVRESAGSAALPLSGGERLVGQSKPLCALREYICKVAPYHSNVLITGETGTGKELVAELIHTNSPRRARPFVCLNSTAIPDSLLESELFGYERGAFTGAIGMHRGKLALAHTGTVFFDEIGDISSAVQAKLLRAIDGKPVYRLGGEREIPLDIRILAATNQDLDIAMEQNRFRRDLYYRLNVVRIKIPPLRDRPDDIPTMINHYIARFNASFGRRVEGFTSEALSQLVSYHWPGNVRELKNVLEAIFVNLPGRRVDSTGLPPCVTQYMATPGRPSERDALFNALVATDWNKTEAARQLRWSRMTLYRKMATYSIGRKPVASRTSAASSQAAS